MISELNHHSIQKVYINITTFSILPIRLINKQTNNVHICYLLSFDKRLYTKTASCSESSPPKIRYNNFPFDVIKATD